MTATMMDVQKQLINIYYKELRSDTNDDQRFERGTVCNHLYSWR